jgi:hypothetical protein
VKILDTVVTCFFIADVFLNFCVGYYDEATQGVVLDLRKVAKRYVLGWFCLDVLAAIPYGWIADYTEVGGDLLIMRSAKSLKILRAIRLFKLVRLKARMDRLEQYFEFIPVVVVVMTVLYIFSVVLSLGHISACIWCFIGYSSRERFGTSWMDLIDAKLEVLGQEPLVRSKDSFSRYLQALHFVLMSFSTVGYGDITPTNPHELYFTQFILLCTAIVFAAILGILTSVFVEQVKRNSKVQEDLQRLANYFEWRKVPERMQLQIRRYVQRVWDEGLSYEEFEESLLGKLNHTLRMQLAYHIYGGVLGSAPFLAWLSNPSFEHCLFELCARCRTAYYEHKNVRTVSHGRRAILESKMFSFSSARRQVQ